VASIVSLLGAGRTLARARLAEISVMWYARVSGGTQETNERKQSEATVREQRRQAVLDASERTRRDTALRAQAQREEEAMRRFEKQQVEQEYLGEARAHRTAALASRASAKMSIQSLFKQKANDAERIRTMTGDLFTYERAETTILQRRQHVNDSYATRYVSTDKADEWMTSPLHSFYAAFKGVVDAASSKSPDEVRL